MNAPVKKWSMNEAWLGARITGPLGTFSLPMPRARYTSSALSSVKTRTVSYTFDSGGRERTSSWKRSKYSFGLGSL